MGWEQDTAELQLLWGLGQHPRSGFVLSKTVPQPRTASSSRLLRRTWLFDDPA